MRMWMVDPRKMCDQHLLGEHVELHMLVGSLRKKKTLTGFLDGGLVELHSIRTRHAELVIEMKSRGFRHASPLPPFRAKRAGKVSIQLNLQELARRCRACRAKLS
jgi:pyrimidine dimer DNA glycosylase